jgi:hypothetical protein
VNNITDICLPNGYPVDSEGNERVPFVKVILDGRYCVMSPQEAEHYKIEAAHWEPETEYIYEDVLLSEAEFEALPEFTGF